MKPETLAKFMHDCYEMHSKKQGWKTQEKCRVEFNNLPVENRQVMIETARDVLGFLKVKAD